MKTPRPLLLWFGLSVACGAAGCGQPAPPPDGAKAAEAARPVMSENGVMQRMAVDRAKLRRKRKHHATLADPLRQLCQLRLR